MLKVNELNCDFSEMKQKLFLNSLNDWANIESARYPLEDKLPDKEEIRMKIINKYLRISCDEGYYLSYPISSIKHNLYTTRSDDNFKSNQLPIYNNRPSEFYIDLKQNLIDMNECHELIKRFIIYEVSLDKNKVNKYGITLVLEYKNNGIIDNPDYSIEVSVGIHDFGNRFMVYNAIDITFWALVVYYALNTIINADSLISTGGYFEIGIFVSYFSQLLFRAKYIKDTFANKISDFFTHIFKRYIKRKKVRYPKNHFTEREFAKHIKRNSSKI